MTPETYLEWASAVDRLENGSAERSFIVAALHLELLGDPENFPAKFFETCYSFSTHPLRAAAEHLVSKNGPITWADIEAELGASTPHGVVEQHHGRSPSVRITNEDGRK